MGQREDDMDSHLPDIRRIAAMPLLPLSA